MWIFRKGKKGGPMQLHTRHSKIQIPPCCKSNILSYTQHFPTPQPSISSLESIQAPPVPCPDLSVHPLLTTQPCSTSHFSSRTGGCRVSSRLSGPGQATEEQGWKTPVSGEALHQGHPTPELCYHHCQQPRTFWLPPKLCWATSTPPKECRMGCRRCRSLPQHSLLQFLLLPRAASSAKHGWKAIFLTNDFVGQRSLWLLLFGYPTVTG